MYGNRDVWGRQSALSPRFLPAPRVKFQIPPRSYLCPYCNRTVSDNVFWPKIKLFCIYHFSKFTSTLTRWRTICSFVDFGLKKYTTCERAANQSRLRETSLMLKLYFIRTRLLAYFNSQKYLIGAET